MTILKFLEKDFKKYYHVLAYIIDDCNYNCQYCYNKKPRSLQSINAKMLIDFLNKLRYQEKRSLDIELLGGEPSLYGDLTFLLHNINKDDRITIYTNLSYEIGFYLSLLNNYSNLKLYISWHSQNTNFLEKINYFSEFKDRISISVMYEPVFSDISLNIFDNVVNNFNSVFTLIDGDYNYYNKDQLQQYLARKIDKQQYLIISNTKKKKISEEELVNLKMNSFFGFRCNTLKDGLYIHNNGNVYPCQNFYTNMKKPLMNICNSDVELKKHFILCPFKYCECGFSFDKSKK